MKKNARKRKSGHVEKLKRLVGNPEKFREEINRLVVSWLYEIEHRKERISIDSPSIFAVLDNAMAILDECGEEVPKDLKLATYGSLAAASCDAFAY